MSAIFFVEDRSAGPRLAVPLLVVTPSRLVMRGLFFVPWQRLDVLFRSVNREFAGVFSQVANARCGREEFLVLLRAAGIDYCVFNRAGLMIEDDVANLPQLPV